MFAKLASVGVFGAILFVIRWLASAAIVNSGFEGKVILGSKNDKTRSVNLKFDPAVVTDYDEAVTAMGAFLTDLAGVSAGVVKSYTITGRAIEDAYNRPTDTDAEWRDTAMLVVDIDDQPLKSGTLFIPMPKIDIFRGTAGVLMDEVDVADTAVINYVANWRATNGLTISDGEKAGLVIYKGERTK